MSGIVLSAATRQSLLAAQDTASLLQTTQNHLATGKKVSSALDNPTNFFTAAGLDNRASDLSGLLDNISNGVQAIQAANTGITNIQKLVDSAKSTATQALSVKANATGSSATAAIATATTAFKGSAGAATDGTHSFSTGTSELTITDGNGQATKVTLNSANLAGKVHDLAKVTDDEVLTEINNQLTLAGGNGAQVAASKTTDGRLVFTSAQTGSDGSVKVETTGANDTDVGFGASTATFGTFAGIDATDGSSKAAATGTAIAALKTAGAGLAASTNYNFTLQLGDGVSKTINLTTGASGGLVGTKGQALGTAIQSQIDADVGLKGKIKVTGSDTTGQLTFHTTDAGADQKLTIKAAASATDIGFGAGGAAAVVANGAGSNSSAVSSQRSALATQFNELLTQITQLAQDSSYNGTNLLYRTSKDPKDNTLHIAFNEKDTSSLDIKGAKLDADGLGISTVTSGFSNDTDIKTALSQLTTAATTLRSQASTFGSNLTVVQNRQDFSKNIINTLQTGSANLTNADLNEEAVNSQALSTRQSLTISALSLANTAQQGVLQLLR